MADRRIIEQVLYEQYDEMVAVKVLRVSIKNIQAGCRD